MTTMKTSRILATALCLATTTVVAQTTDSLSLRPKVGGTLRAKYEWQTAEKEGRFEVRTARVNITGNLSKVVSYKAEVDLSDEGRIKMLDAYTRLRSPRGWQFTLGQMRVPFTVDAHRSPHLRYFANRSFIAKQVGNVRDVGAAVGLRLQGAMPTMLEAGLFNGSGLTNQKDFWTSRLNFSVKAQTKLRPWLTMTLSAQQIRPDSTRIFMWDGALTLHHGPWMVEAEYLHKTYAHQLFRTVHAVDVFASYDVPLRHALFRKLSPLVRWDYMSDHSDGKRYLQGKANPMGALMVNDPQRSRITAGLTLSLLKPFVSDIRLNYEHYFYRQPDLAKPSERSKVVLEVMTHF